MKTLNKKIKPKYLFIVIIILIGFTSCYYEDYWIVDGRDGDAYLALSWSQDEPDYIDAGTRAIPSVFYWDEYYYIRPGIYYLYYDGIHHGVEYAWEVEYEIYINLGEKGTIFYDGWDGEDNYFTIDLNPYGPYVYLDYKSEPVNTNYKILEDSGLKIVILKEEKDFSLKVTYKKTERQKHE